ncbi:hypothetical protein BDR26DRAFT_861814 [Obelidium mucronatum]|nr:hypothetical protein BDR26DRAFT_861814 [Obelidium mucronatum]
MAASFVPFRSGSTVLNAGVLHLFREAADCDDDADAGFDEAKNTNTNTNTLCILAAPVYMTAPDLLVFIAPYTASISHIRFLRDSIQSRSMVLIRFRDGKAFEGEADAFYAEYSGKPFNSLDDEVCRVVYIKSVHFESQAIPQFAFPPTANDPNSIFTIPNQSSPVQANASPLQSQEVAETEESPASSDLSNMIELPTCPVCLDRMDASVTGLVTILCHHSFHCNCLSKWQDASCPVCRYSSTHQPQPYSVASSAEPSFPHHSILQQQRHQQGFNTVEAGHQNDSQIDTSPTPGQDSERVPSQTTSNPPENHCSTCNTSQNLWICLICGNVGCGRYQSAHAAAHYTTTAHLYSLELETQRVWDYAGDGYVHRLIRTGQDGKVVELSAPAAAFDGSVPFAHLGHSLEKGKGKGKSMMNGRSGRGGGGVAGDHGFGLDESGEDVLGLEYSVLLSSQLESQRCWYEEKMDALTIESSEKVQELAHELENLQKEKQTVENERDSILRDATCARKQLEDRFARDRDRLEKKFDKVMERVAGLEKAFAEERQINEGLRQNQDVFLQQIQEKDKQLAEKTKQVEDLTDQVRDLMFYLETQQKVNESPELQNGDVVIETTHIPETGSSSSTGKSKSKKKKK